MSKPQDGGQAFPAINPDYDGNWNKSRHLYGMSLRDWFAGQALIGVLTGEAQLLGSGRLSQPMNCPESAKLCYQMADAILKAREVKS